MLRVIEYFAKSVKITQGHWKWYHSKAWVQFPICVHSNYGRILYCFWDIVRYWSKIGMFSNPLAFNASVGMSLPVGILP